VTFDNIYNVIAVKGNIKIVSRDVEKHVFCKRPLVRSSASDNAVCELMTIYWEAIRCTECITVTFRLPETDEQNMCDNNHSGEIISLAMAPD